MKYYKISEDDLLRLLESQAIYDALRGGGVDNWGGYNWSIQSFCDELGCDIDEAVQEDLRGFEALN